MSVTKILQDAHLSNHDDDIQLSDTPDDLPEIKKTIPIKQATKPSPFTKFMFKDVPMYIILLVIIIIILVTIIFVISKTKNLTKQVASNEARELKLIGEYKLLRQEYDKSKEFKSKYHDLLNAEIESDSEELDEAKLESELLQD